MEQTVGGDSPLNFEGKFTGDEAGPIDLETAVDWTRRYREQNPKQVKAHFFGRNILEKILAQPGCMGLRIYYAIDPEDNKHLLVVGADATQTDQLPGTGILPGSDIPFSDVSRRADATGGVDPIIAEMSIPCPNQCGHDGKLQGK
ncbi:hypothetical protein [Hymenobacter weizhouensis]|uniref:hypothetical protein n=1 Tax=Hymenobacter sp. YIM 151500-1 TaxID=2987689 RepID=UPI00222673A7|nr:hypothetical protein [Hymenobacter sp. YIM 151500-1]UYZ62107.1 hypothetical protein OIS53_13960 [Hymenobacter sp. YIM 151500-1]